jgi:hypothetical protein
MNPRPGSSFRLEQLWGEIGRRWEREKAFELYSTDRPEAARRHGQERGIHLLDAESDVSDLELWTRGDPLGHPDLARQGDRARPAPATTAQPVPAQPGGPQGSITIQQNVNQPAATPSGSGPRVLAVLLIAACAMGAFLCFLWTGLIKRSEGMNDYLVAHMKDLEENHLSQITNMRKYDTLFEKRTGKWWGGTKEVVFKSETVKLPWWESLFRLYQVWLWTAVGFIVLWVVFGVAPPSYISPPAGRGVQCRLAKSMTSRGVCCPPGPGSRRRN